MSASVVCSPMASSSTSIAVHRPIPREGPRVPYANNSGSNPVLRGYTLAVVSSIISASSYIQSIFWRLNKFDVLKDIEDLHDYEPRHDPTVIPKLPAQEERTGVADLPQPRARASEKAYYTCADYYELYKSGKLTPKDVAEYLLPLIQRDTQPAGPHSVAFLQVRADLVRAAAAASTARYAAGNPLSALDGVPIAIKDEVNLTGYKRSLGSKLDFSDAGDRTAWCVAKWQEAGALIIGKTNMHELGLDTTNNNVNFGTPRNPHNEGYYTGGSSGGSAFAVATGLCPMALGVDGGGSIRLPASFCGVFGLKTTHGRVSARAGYEMWDSVAVNGPMASSMDDLALAYRIMAQPDSGSRFSSAFPSPLLKQPKAPGSRQVLGVYQDWINRSDPAVLTLFNRAIDFYAKSHGYDVIDITIPYLPEGQKAHALSILSESRSRVSKDQIRKLTYHNQLLLNVAGSHATAQDFLFAQRLRSLQMQHLAWLWEKHPGLLIVTPTTPCAGWKIAQPADVAGYGVSDGDMSLKSMEYVYFANWTGAPAISLPMGYADGAVPVGLMAMAEWGNEEQLLDFGRQGENLVGEEGINRPKGEGSWVDVLASAQKS